MTETGGVTHVSRGDEPVVHGSAGKLVPFIEDKVDGRISKKGLTPTIAPLYYHQGRIKGFLKGGVVDIAGRKPPGRALLFTFLVVYGRGGKPPPHHRIRA